MAAKKTVSRVVFRHYSWNGKSDYKVSFVLQGSRIESGHHSLFLCGSVFSICQQAVLLALYGVCCLKQRDRKRSVPVWNSGDPWEGPLSKYSDVINQYCPRKPCKRMDTESNREVRPVTEELVENPAGKKHGNKDTSKGHSEVRGIGRTSCTALSSATLKCTRASHSKSSTVGID